MQQKLERRRQFFGDKKGGGGCICTGRVFIDPYADYLTTVFQLQKYTV